MSKRINIGIVGCGEATQVLHLPTLRELPELFDVAAFCDVSPSVLNSVADAWPAAGRYASAEELVADPRIDAVLVANPNAYHAEVALAAMRRGKHVLIEKPVCVTQAEGQALLAAVNSPTRVSEKES